jgi:hypothetical protein
VLLEDGGRLFQMAAMAPEAFWSAALQKMLPMLASFELREARGTKVPLLPGSPPPPLATETSAAASETPSVATETRSSTGETAPAATELPPASAAQPTPFLKPEELIALALADDAASLDPEHRINANLRDRGAGLVPRVVSTDSATKSARLAAGAIEGFFRVPFGWHVIDDGKRTLIFDAGGRIQVNVSQRLHENASPAEFARQLLQQYLEQQPDLPTIETNLAGIAAAGVRGVTIENETLDQYFMVRDVGRVRLYIVARVSATKEDSTRALDLAGDIVATFEGPAA